MDVKDMLKLAIKKYAKRKLIAFTFDDGPSQYTEALLDELKVRKAAVTFFMTGENGIRSTYGIKNKHEALLSRMWEEGHQMANHTYQHASFDKLSAEEIVSEVTRVEELIFRAIGGSYTCFVRTPGGYINETILRNVNAPIILWSVDTLDWKHRDADYVYHKILSCAKNGSIVLMHDMYKTSIDGALRAVDALQEQGYEFVTVSELMRRTGIGLTPGVVYSGANGRRGFRPAYKAPAIAAKSCSTGVFQITCSVSHGLSAYYTTDGSYPRLSDKIYDGTVFAEPGTVFTAIGVDKWGMRTPTARMVVESGKNMRFG